MYGMVNQSLEDLIVTRGGAALWEQVKEDAGVDVDVFARTQGKAGGTTLLEFLTNLPDLHTRVSLLFPHLKPPEFRCSDIQSDCLCLHYYSTRSGLTPFVKGLIQGLGVRFETPVEVTCVASRDQGADHDLFHIKWTETSR